LRNTIFANQRRGKLLPLLLPLAAGASREVFTGGTPVENAHVRQATGQSISAMAKSKGVVGVASPGRELGFLRDARESYAEQWSRDAAAFAAQGLYAWMTGHLAGFSLILEIGCGDGTSTLELVNQGHKVIAVDENPSRGSSGFALQASLARYSAALSISSCQFSR
jgi:hypothetical protein